MGSEKQNQPVNSHHHVTFESARGCRFSLIAKTALLSWRGIPDGLHTEIRTGQASTVNPVLPAIGSIGGPRQL